MRGLKFLVLGIAIMAGLGAVALVRTELERARALGERDGPAIVQTNNVRVLVAARDMQRGETLKPEDLRWQDWPKDLVSETFTTQSQQPNALEQAGDFMVRSPFVAGEPITEAKLIRMSHPGVMSALVRQGFRAMAIEVSLETGAGGFILPGDYVDVILTRRVTVETQRSDGSFTTGEMIVTNTLLSTVRVMAIDTVFQTEGEATAPTKRTATLEVDPSMAELLSYAEEAGRLTLSLRSLAELVGPDGEVLDEPTPTMLIDSTVLSGGGLPLPGDEGTSDVGPEGEELADVAAPPPSPRFGDGKITIVRGGVTSRATVE